MKLSSRLCLKSAFVLTTLILLGTSMSVLAGGLGFQPPEPDGPPMEMD